MNKALDHIMVEIHLSEKEERYVQTQYWRMLDDVT